ncbi:MAG: hypothetical protein IKW58_02800 [Alphaproteobacteria bacterium]|nr:hypothetical protein [Alphaproteobacteria bacterium]
MRYMSKFIKSLLISVFILTSATKHANAFFLIPPMPWDIEINIPGNANKVVSNLKSYYRQLQALKNKDFTELLQSAKLGNLEALGGLKGLMNETMSQLPKSEKKGEIKTADKKGIISDSELGISENSVIEKEYYDAYYKLFFQLPPKSSYSGNYNVLKTAFAEKRLDYQQDVVIDTYLYGRMNEDYLILVNETINRLDECRMGVKRDGTVLTSKEDYEDYCVFFGMQFAYSDPTKEKPLGTEDEDPGSLGEQMNAYIIAVMYDRMLRIVEDLTAVEAMYRSAKQIELVEPIVEKTSDAAEFINNKYQFAYNSNFEYKNAKIDPTSYSSGSTLNSKTNRSDYCENGGEGCAVENKDGADKVSSIEDTEILAKLQPIDDYLQKAMTLHNLKSELPEYKGQYRKYLKAIEVHDRTLKVLGQSDDCVVDFISRHLNKGVATELWYGLSVPQKPNEYQARGGVSREILEEYQKYITDTIIEKEDGVCDGFYDLDTCPVGYRSDVDNPCDEDKSKYPCIVDTITTDMEVAENSDASSDADDTDGLEDATKANEIENDNRMKAERSWRIGSEKVVELTKQGKLAFKQWNDQQDIQKKYLENKYRNMRIIIKTMDKAQAAYKIAAYLSSQEQPNDANEPIAKLITKATSVKTVDKAVGDGSALNEARSKNSSICSGFNCASPNYCTKTVDTWYMDRCSYVNSDGNRVWYDCKKEGTTTLTCSAAKSSTAGYADVIEETYTGGDKSKKTTRHTKAADLRIKNNPSSYSVHIKDTPLNYADMINSENQSTSICDTTWDFTITGIVRKFMPKVLGGCKTTMDAQAENIYQTAHNNKRVVARDKLDKVLKEKDEQEKKIKDNIRKWTLQIDKLKREKEQKIKSLNTYTTVLKSSIEKKNQIVSLRKDSENRIEAIKSEKANLTQRLELDLKGKSKIESLAKDAEKLARSQIKMLDIELQCIQTGDKFCKQCTNAETCEKDVKVEVNCSDYSVERCPAVEGTFISLKFAEKQISTHNKSIERYEALLSGIKKDITKKEEQIQTALEEFAEDYIEIAEKAQDEIEKVNKEYEEFVSKNGYRMTVNKFKGDDGLTETIHRAIAKKEVKPFAKEKIESLWLSSNNVNKAAQSLSSLGLPTPLVFAEEMDFGMGVKLSPGTYTSLTTIINQVKGQIAEAAATIITQKIDKADTITTKEMEDAVEEVNKWSGNTLCLEGEGDDVVSPNCKGGKNITADAQYFDIMKYENYMASDGLKDGQIPSKENGGIITQGHLDLIQNLRKPTPENEELLANSGVDLGKIFGIPNDEIITTDNEYFVALPARGVANTSPTCTYTESDYHLNDGCDYMAPREPLASIPPLREVFYFSALDYEDVPRSDKKRVPTISHLLNYKYPSEKFEYLPEVWRYLLARPNLRDDGKYQQTFIERGYGQNEIIDYLKEFKDAELNTITARGGIYPCRLSSAMDVKGAGSVKKIAFKTRSSIPAGAASLKCTEIANYKGKLQHLLADFNPRAKTNPALQSYSGSTAESMYLTHSELGQFLAPHSKKRLKYRDLLKDAFTILQDVKKESEDSNNFTRQMAETVSFKRNVMGSFLENVNIEIGANKNRKKATEDVKATLRTLCEQLHEYEKFVGNEENLEGEEKLNACVDVIMTQKGGLAKSSEDNDYDIKASSPNSFYKTVFQNLDGWKDENLNKAKKELNNLKSIFSKDTQNRVSERIEEIEVLIKSLEADKNEKVAIRPGDTADEVKKAIKEYDAQRPLALDKEEEALISMDNQSRSVAYCPVY